MRKDLIEAYVGHFEDDWDTRQRYDRYVTSAEGEACPSFEYWLESEVEDLIRESSPKRRLEIYLEWNGIIGYERAIFAIATGEV